MKNYTMHYGRLPMNSAAAWMVELSSLDKVVVTLRNSSSQFIAVYINIIEQIEQSGNVNFAVATI